MIAYKLNSDAAGCKAGRYVTETNCNGQNQLVLLGTPNLPQQVISTHDLSFIKVASTEVDLLEETWLHPHLYKPVKDQVKQLTNY